MHRVFKRVVFLLSILTALSHFFPGVSLAIDNNELSDEFICDISINGAPSDTSSIDSSSLFTATRNESGALDMSVTLSESARRQFQSCQGQLQVALLPYQRNGFGSILNFNRWEPFALNSLGNGRFSGFVEPYHHANDNSSGYYSYYIHIEMSSGVCEPTTYPICKEARINIANRNIVNNTSRNTSECRNQIEEIRTAVSNFPTNVALTSTGITYVYLPNEAVSENDYFYSACSATEIKYEVFRNGNKINEGTLIGGGVGPSIGFDATRVGSYELVVSLLQSGNVPNADPRGDSRAFQRITKKFCVYNPNTEENCDPDSFTNSIENTETDSDRVNFNICSQIPTPNADYLSRQISRVSERASGPEALQSIVERQEKFDYEKRRCCECATGLSDYNPSTGQCANSSEEAVGVYTALGCFPAKTEDVIQQLILVGLSISGSVALLMILSGAFMLTTSQGEPKRAGEAKEMITSAVMGLLFIIFSVTILQFIGVTILRIPGFGQAL